MAYLIQNKVHVIEIYVHAITKRNLRTSIFIKNPGNSCANELFPSNFLRTYAENQVKTRISVLIKNCATSFYKPLPLAMCVA